MPNWDLPITIAMIATLVGVTVVLHYEGLGILSQMVRRMRNNPRTQMLAIILGVFIVHVLEISIYAWSYWFGDKIVNIGDFVGSASLAARDLFYFSAETYTGLGYGDISPTGDLRLLVSIETLNGLLLLGGTTSYTFVAMQQYWSFDEPPPPTDTELLRVISKRFHPDRMDHRSAQMLGLEALRWVAIDGVALERFLTATGLEAQALRDGANRRETAVAVLDFLIFNPDLLHRYCKAAHVRASAVHAARQHLDNF
jgi:hypothetical protein